MTGLTTAQVSDMLRITPEVLAFLTRSGPFEPIDDNMTPRQIFGVSLTLALGMLPAAQAIEIATAGAFEARPGGDRWLVISWPDRTPGMHWLDRLPQSARPHLPLFAIPADSLLDATIEHIAAMARPN